MPEERSVAVLPFEDLDRDPDRTWFARGLAEDLIAELSRFPQLEVIHAHSSFSEELRQKADHVVGSELRARYLLRGTVRRGGGHVVVSTRLVESATDRQVAVQRFDAPEDELPGLELEIASAVAASLALRIDDAHLARARRKRIEDLQAYECWLRGMDLLRRGTAEHDREARRLFQQALDVDAHFARAYAGISLSYFNEWSCQAWAEWDEKERLAFEAARRASELDDADHVTQLILGKILLFRRNFAAAARRFDLALHLNPNDADALVQISLGLCLLGDAERAIELLSKAKRLNPKHDDWYYAFELYPRYSLEDYAEVLRLVEIARGKTVDATAYGAAAAALLGEGDAASEQLAVFLSDFRERILFGREPEPGEPLRWLQHVNPFFRRDDDERLMSGLVAAGLTPDPDASRRASAASATTAGGATGTFRPAGEAWEISFRGARVLLSGVKGFTDLATLMRSPGEAVHCLELAGRPASADDGDEAFDLEARERIRRRARELEEELDSARAHDDEARITALRSEMDRLVGEVSRSLGLDGRCRAIGSAAEKARSAVTWRIRSAIRKIAAAHPALGRHLSNSLRTGTFCVYEPDTDVTWLV